MAELDYVLLAEFARVDPSGLLTVVGGSYSQLHTDELPVQAVVYVVARIMVDPEEDDLTVRVSVAPVDRPAAAEVVAYAARPSGIKEADRPGFVLMVVAVPAPLQVEGWHVATVAVEGGPMKSASFEVVAAATARDD